MHSKTIEYLTDPALAAHFMPVVIASGMLAIAGGILSPFVVLKRMAFVGQGVSHAAFLGVGAAVMLGITGGVAMTASITGVCLVAALAIGWLSRRDHADTAIGIVLVLAMALGFLFHRSGAESLARQGRQAPGIESVLFGDLLSVGMSDVVVLAIYFVVIMGVLHLKHKTLMAWAFDEEHARVIGLPTGAARMTLLVLVALAVVMMMRLAGVILATALIVLPGATALRCSTRFGPVLILSVAIAASTMMVGVVLSLEADLQMGPCIVLSQGLAWAIARIVVHFRNFLLSSRAERR